MTPAQISYEAYRARRRKMHYDKAEDKSHETELKANRIMDAMLLGVPVDQVDSVQESFFGQQSEKEAVAAEPDVDNWSKTSGTFVGESTVASYTDAVDVKINQINGKYEA